VKSVVASVCLGLLGWGLLWLAPALADPRPQNPAAAIWYSEQFIVHSRFVGRDFLIQVARPHKPPSAKVPAIYVLDGDTRFGEVADMAGEFADTGDITPAYVIGIAYPDQTAETWRTLREHDYLHVARSGSQAEAAGFGEGAKFQRFISEELRPLIEARYPVAAERAILLGHSFGGLFALHVLLNDPGAFATYLIGSPSIWAEPGLLDQAAAFKAGAPVRVFLGVGAREEAQVPAYHLVTNVEALAARLKDHASGAEVELWEAPEETHVTMVPAFISRALRFALGPPAS
jgi:uncharacterized protein